MNYQSKIESQIKGPKSTLSIRSTLLEKLLKSFQQGGVTETTSFINNEMCRLEQLFNEKLDELRKSF